MNIPIGIRKKLLRIKKCLLEDFEAGESSSNITSNVESIIESSIERVPFRPQPGNYPEVSYKLDTVIHMLNYHNLFIQQLPLPFI